MVGVWLTGILNPAGPFPTLHVTPGFEAVNTINSSIHPLSILLPPSRIPLRTRLSPTTIMNRFSIAQDVTKRLPKMQVVIVVAHNLNNEAENPAVTDFAQVRP